VQIYPVGYQVSSPSSPTVTVTTVAEALAYAIPKGQESYNIPEFTDLPTAAAPAISQPRFLPFGLIIAQCQADLRKISTFLTRKAWSNTGGEVPTKDLSNNHI
jgi:hypothetical protein